MAISKELQALNATKNTLSKEDYTSKYLAQAKADADARAAQLRSQQATKQQEFLSGPDVKMWTGSGQAIVNPYYVEEKKKAGWVEGGPSSTDISKMIEMASKGEQGAWSPTSGVTTKLPTLARNMPSVVAPAQQMTSGIVSQGPSYQPVQSQSGMSDMIRNKFKSLSDSQIASVRQRVADAVAKQNQTISTAGQQFDPLRAQSEVAKANDLRTAMERASNLGDRGGVARSEALATQTAGENRLNEIGLAQSNLINQANAEIARLQNEGRSQEAEIVATNSYNELQALMDETRRLEDIQREDRLAAENIARQDTIRNEDLARETAQQTSEQERADFQNKIMANYDDISAFANQLESSGAPQWQIDQARAAVIQKRADLNLDKQGKPIQADNTQAIVDMAKWKWNAGMALTPQEQQAIGATTSTKPKSVTGGGSSGPTTTQNRNYALDLWQALGKANQTVADMLGVNVGDVYKPSSATEPKPTDVSGYEDYINNYLVNEDPYTGQKSINRQGTAKYIYDLMARGEYGAADRLMALYGISEQEVETIERVLGNRR